jgi:hypothetical protein
VLDFEVRWSALESRKPYARPFGVVFADPGRPPRGLTLTGADLLFYGGFRIAVLEMLGELVDDATAEASPDPQRAWLDRLAGLLPPASLEAVIPVDHQDERYGMQHRFLLRLDGASGPPPVAEAAVLLDYQLVQATVAHQSGALLRLPAVEAVDDPAARRAAWLAVLRPLLSAPGSSGELVNPAS